MTAHPTTNPRQGPEPIAELPLGQDGWILDLERRLREPLPGAHAGGPYEPLPQDGRHYQRPAGHVRGAAVLLLLYPCDGRWHIPLARRDARLTHHAGQICLPGGVIDPGETAEQAAVREFYEELGAPGTTVRLLGRLTPLSTHVTRFWIQPVVGVTYDRPTWRLSSGEIDLLLEPPLAELLDPRALKAPIADREEADGVGDHQRAAEHPHLEWRRRRIWGATCMMLGELLTLVREVREGM